MSEYNAKLKITMTNLHGGGSEYPFTIDVAALTTDDARKVRDELRNGNFTVDAYVEEERALEDWPTS